MIATAKKLERMSETKLRFFAGICKRSQRSLKKFLDGHLKELGYATVNADGYLYAPGSNPVLLVAHLDTVHRSLPSTTFYITQARELWCDEGIGGDDRCGVYAVLKLAEMLDCHVLFTEDEEIGCVGARKFCKSGIDIDVKYIVEFDRKGGNDAIFYDCDNPKFESFVNQFGFVTEWGSYSDISEIAPHLKTAAVNLSSAYYRPHSKNEYVKIDELEQIIGRAAEMIQEETEKFEYVERQRTHTRSRWSSKDYRDVNRDDTWKDEKWAYDKESQTLIPKVETEDDFWLEEVPKEYVMWNTVEIEDDNGYFHQPGTIGKDGDDYYSLETDYDSRGELYEFAKYCPEVSFDRIDDIELVFDWM